jgi:hypothetical protein
MGDMAQNQTEIIAKGPWYEIYREVGEDVVRLVVKYTDRYDASIYAVRVIELRGDDTLHMYARWNFTESKGERVITAVKLQPEVAALWRSRMLAVKSARDFESLLWELDMTYVTKSSFFPTS